MVRLIIAILPHLFYITILWRAMGWKRHNVYVADSSRPPIADATPWRRSQHWGSLASATFDRGVQSASAEPGRDIATAMGGPGDYSSRWVEGCIFSGNTVPLLEIYLVLVPEIH